MPMLDYMRGRKLLDKYRIKSIDSMYVKSADEAVAFAKHSRLVLKLITEKAIHKSRAGLVKLDLADEKEIRTAFGELTRKGKKFMPYKVLAQKMASGGVEVIIGGNTDSQFGKMLLLGLGGIYVETFKDVQLRLCPITRKDALHMISELKSGSVVSHKGKATNMIADLLMKVSRLLVENKKVSELDLNPVIIRNDSYDVVDIRIIS